MENVVEQIKQDLEGLALEHLSAAKNEQIWALGSEGEDAELHTQNAEMQLAVANMFQRMADNARLLVEQFGGR